MVGFVICDVIDEFDIDLMDLFDMYGFNRVGKRCLQIRILNAGMKSCRSQ